MMSKNYQPLNLRPKNILFHALLIFFSLSLFAQNQGASSTEILVDWDVCTYYPAPNSHKSYIKVPNYIREKMANGGGGCSTFIVTYNGFTPQAEAAFQFAVDIWSNSIVSAVPIRITADFSPLATNVLGRAGPTSFRTVPGSGFPSNTVFPIALAEKLTGMEIPDGASPISQDITALFSSTANFYFGLDGNTPNGQVDFVSVVLHEIGHGLGFLGFGRVPTDANGDVDPNPPVDGVLRNQGFLSSWDLFIENGTPNDITSFADPSAALLTEFTSDDLFCNGPNATAQNGGLKPSTHAPSTFRSGSSYSHWDETTYPVGNANSLMTPSIAPGEAIHNPGLVTLGFMEDMGWTICANALPVTDFKDDLVSVSPNPFSASITIRLNSVSDSDAINIRLLDINGRVILNTTEISEDGIVKLSNLNQLEDTFYFVKITNERNGTSITKKIIKI